MRRCYWGKIVRPKKSPKVKTRPIKVQQLKMQPKVPFISAQNRYSLHVICMKFAYICKWNWYNNYCLTYKRRTLGYAFLSTPKESPYQYLSLKKSHHKIALPKKFSDCKFKPKKGLRTSPFTIASMPLGIVLTGNQLLFFHLNVNALSSRQMIKIKNITNLNCLRIKSNS